MAASAPAPASAPMPPTIITTAWSPPDDDDVSPPDAVRILVQDLAHSDLELHLLQSFGSFALDKILGTYLSVKQSSRLLGFMASTTEALLSKTGLWTIVGFGFAQYQRLGHPWVAYVDDAMGRRIIAAFVQLLWLAQNDDDDVDTVGRRLTLVERVRALLYGDLPRLEALLAAAGGPTRRPPLSASVVMDLAEFVPREDVRRLQDANREQLLELHDEIMALREQLGALEQEKQQLEQDLIDVHNYQETERGRQFQEMEEELARAKLEASYKTHELRKLELLVEALKRRRRGKSERSYATAPSTTSSDGPLSP